MTKLYSILASCMHTRYTIDMPEGPALTFAIGVFNPELDRLLRYAHTSTFAYLTAWNPHSTNLNQADNQQRHQQLCRDLQQRNITFLTGYAIPNTEEWEPEACVFAFNMSRTIVHELCETYAQDCAVVGDWGAARNYCLPIQTCGRTFSCCYTVCP
jgi:hypothetical protein